MDEERKNSILVVDDEKFNLEVLCNILTPEYTVYLTKNGSSAINMAQKYMPDLILLDIIMPEISGYDVLAALKSKEETKHIPIIFITGLNKVEDEEAGLALDAVDFIHKPFSAKTVRIRVKNQIQLHKQIKELNEIHKNYNEAKAALKTISDIAENELKNSALQANVKEAFSKIHRCSSL